MHSQKRQINLKSASSSYRLDWQHLISVGQRIFMCRLDWQHLTSVSQRIFMCRLDWQHLFNFSQPKDLSCADWIDNICLISVSQRIFHVHIWKQSGLSIKSGLSVFTQVYQTQNSISQCKVHEPLAESPLTSLPWNYERSLRKGGYFSDLDDDTQHTRLAASITQHNGRLYLKHTRFCCSLTQHNSRSCLKHTRFCCSLTQHNSRSCLKHTRFCCSVTQQDVCSLSCCWQTMAIIYGNWSMKCVKF